MQFNLRNTLQTFQRWMDEIFKELKDFGVVYINNILVFSKTREKHKHHLKIVCDKFIENGIILSPKKIEIEKIEIKF